MMMPAVATTAVLLASALAEPSVSAAAETLLLAPGSAVERALAPGETQVFAVALTTGRPYRIAAEQRGIDVVVEVRGPQGASLAAVDGPLERWGVEEILLRPAAEGLFRIEVRAEKKGVGSGRYEIRLDELAEATPAERERAAALAAVTTAGGILARHAPGGPEQALAAFQEAREHFRSAGDRRGDAEAVTAVAALSRQLGRREQAAALYREAASLWQELGLARREMRAWNDLGLTLWEMSNNLPAADTALARGLDLARTLGDEFGQADLRNNQCLILHARGQLRAALDCYGEPLALFRRLGEAREEATVLNNLGFAEYNLGEPQLSEVSYGEALSVRRAIGDRAGEAQTLNNLAVLSRSLGEVGSALDRYRAALEILATLDDRRLQATALNNLGVVYTSLGEAERARIYLTQALELRRKVEDRRGEIVTLNNLGWLESTTGAPDKAIPFHQQALELALATSDSRNEGLSRSFLGEAWSASGRLVAAVAELDRALALHRQAGDRYSEALALRRKGQAVAAAGRPAEALPLLDQALSLARAMGDRNGEAAALTARARTLRDTGQLDAARTEAEAAVAALESLRTGLSNPDLRASFLGSRREAYELHIDILMRLDAAHPGQGFDSAAFEASEQAHARTLLDFLRESGPEIRKGVEPALAARLRELERRLALKAERRQSLLGRGQADRPEVKALEIEIEQVTAELDTADAEIRKQNPRYAELTRPEAASTREIQALLDPETLLLEYSLGRERSYLWVLGAASLCAFVLPGREEIERAARAFHEAVSSPPSSGAKGRSRIGKDLAHMLLGPIAGQLGRHRLAIVADGALHYIPFDVLPEPAGVPLLHDHEVVVLPSASVLAAQRRELAHRPPAPRLAIVFADPVFNPDDPRIARSGRPAQEPTAPAPASPYRGDEPVEKLRLGRLRFSRQEALGITSLSQPGNVATELDFAASRSAALSGQLRDYRYIHFATHGIFDTKRPELSGLVLSRLDVAGHPQEGFLGLRDLYDLDLAADLVVLSGCETALGKEIRGEGLLGLTRGFLYAGAPRVVASLWWIDDRATTMLMERLYRGLWVQGLRPAAALRQARLALTAGHRYRDPFYWGAFVLQGDWR
jgi:CHAT domain-containing protein/Tfp pilus assembly protein PilF